MDERHLTEEFMRAHPRDAAMILEGLRIEDTAEFLETADPELSSKVIRHMEPLSAARCLEAMSPRRSAAVVEGLPTDVASALLRRVQSGAREEVLDNLSGNASAALRLVLRYPEGTAGSLMDPEVFVLPDDITVREALVRVREHPEHLVHYIFVVNREQLLVGFTSMSRLLLERPEDRVFSVMERQVGRLSPTMKRQAILANPAWREVHVLPVVDNGGVFLGAIGYKTMHALEKEAEEGRPANGATTVSALGELYWLGLGSVVKGLMQAFKPEKE